jgi:RNA polymerase sigma-70 factor, ECF subfamily
LPNYRKRGGVALRASFEETLAVSEEQEAEIAAIDEALVALAAVDARKSQVVELHFLGGLSVEETAEVLKVPLETVKRDWRFAKAWLHRVRSGEKGDESGALAAS